MRRPSSRFWISSKSRGYLVQVKVEREDSKKLICSKQMLGNLLKLITVITIKKDLKYTWHKSKYLDQLQDALIGFFVCLNGEYIILISFGD